MSARSKIERAEAPAGGGGVNVHARPNCGATFLVDLSGLKCPVCRKRIPMEEERRP